MKLEHLPHGSLTRLRLQVAGAVPAPAVPAGTELRLSFPVATALPLLAAGDWIAEVSGVAAEDTEALEHLRAQGLPRLAWLFNYDDASGLLTLQVHSFLQAVAMPECDFGLDEAMLVTLRRMNPRLKPTLASAVDWMHEQFLIGAAGAVHAFVNVDSKAKPGVWQLFGRNAIATLELTRLEDGADVLRVVNLKRPNRLAPLPLALMSGALRFVDASVAGRLRTLAAAELDTLIKSGSSFLDLWNGYRTMEDDATLRAARAAGHLVYEHVESLPDNRFSFTLAEGCDKAKVDTFCAALAEGRQSIEAALAVPEILTQGGGWEHAERRDPQTPVVLFKGDPKYQPRERRMVLTQQGTEQDAPPACGVLFLSLMGDRSRIERRHEAYSLIAEARCPMPQLGLLLEGRDVPSRQTGTQSGIPAAVQRKVYGERAPTAAQRRAIEVALNTPDIALIQGPPGTGKTTVIVALVECLQRMWGDGGQGRLLLSGFQHDAVENAIKKMNVNGLPALKFGGRGGPDASKGTDQQIDAWARGRAEAIRAQHPGLGDDAQPNELAALIQGYVQAPGTLEQTAHMLADLARRLRLQLTAALCAALLGLGRELADKARAARFGDAARDRRHSRVRALRFQPLAFADDGARNAQRLHDELANGGIAGAVELALLRQAAAWRAADAPPFLAELRALRRRLQLVLTPAARTHDAMPQVRGDVLELLGQARDELARLRRRNAADEAVQAFLQTLEEDPESIHGAVLAYTSVYAATCQQSARPELKNLRPEGGYDTVVVDEAARANPLDLFVPLAQARRRIVLVGDHRQLPHIVDQELARELEQVLDTAADANRPSIEVLNRSLFEHLFNQLREREKRDGIQRVVTLDQQFRMHPTLGQFVSDQFYKDEEAFDSPTPAAEFAHSLPGYPGPAAWLSVPRARGEEKPDASKSRYCEADAIVRALQGLMRDPAGATLTFGIITFYSAQVLLVRDALVRHGLAELDEEGEVRIKDGYREVRLPNGKVAERLRFGTVDAFQGMEFDVVFLSMVRSNGLPDGDERARRRKYGHLMSANRMCVAMSRQQRLLIVAGDVGMLKAPHAAEAIGPLVKFHEMSEVVDGA